MRLDLNMSPLCNSTRDCGLATVCKQHRCGPCSSDYECLKGEKCVLDHCLLAQQVECRTRHDCPEDALCILSGYSDGLRANAQTKAVCLASRGGQAPNLPAEEAKPSESEPRPQVPIDSSSTLRSLRKEFQKRQAEGTLDDE
jgi:hypothetical protein